MRRRQFLHKCAGGVVFPWVTTALTPVRELGAAEDDALSQKLEAHRPSRLARLPADFCDRVGATHVAGKYHLTGKPFLLEGADRLLSLGTRVGKFWFMPGGAGRDYPFNSSWQSYGTFTELAKSDYFAQLFSRPFTTIMLEAHSPVEQAWNSAQPEEFYERVTEELYSLTAHLYRTYRDRKLTFILQHWEGDWLLRGAGKSWNPPPADWEARCTRLQRWLAARQAGVGKARTQFGDGAVCRVGHAAEVNRVADIWNGIPTMTDKVLPAVTLDLVSYSAYDGMRDPLTLWKCIAKIRKHARTTGVFGDKAVYLGEIGIPENDQPTAIAERWDRHLGAALAAGVGYVVQWELYCNELNPKAKPAPKTPVRNPADVRGFWLVRPDDSLSETGNYFASLWKRASGAG